MKNGKCVESEFISPSKESFFFISSRMAEAQSQNEEEKKLNNDSEEDPSKAIHTKSRTSPYPNTQQKRYSVPDDKVKWSTQFKGYQPPFYTHPSVVKHKLPDASLEKIKSDKSITFNFNQLDNKINRASHLGTYALDKNNYNLPLNPMGRTGLSGRGHLWRWGPNHAADPIVTRWMRKDNQSKNEIIQDEVTNKGILEFVAIERTDGGGWAIPGLYAIELIY